MDDGPVLLLRVLVSLLCVVGLIWVVARKVGATPGRRVPTGPSLQVVGRQALGRHAGVAVLAVGDRRLLLGYGEQQVTMLTELAPVPVDEPAPGREVAARPVVSPLPASLLRFVSAHRRRPVDVPVVVPAPAVDAGDALVPLSGETAPETAPDADTNADNAVAVAVPGAAGDAHAAPVVPTQATRAPSALDGSILSPTTWRRAVTTLQERTVRR